MAVPDWARDLFERIAVDRLPGTPGVRAAQDAIAAQLTSLGFHVRREPFLASTRPLAAVSVAGAGLGWTALAAAPLLAVPIGGWLVSAVGVATLAVVGLLAWGVAAGRLPGPWATADAVNLVAAPATDAEPRVWLVAHADAKAQAFSLAGRVVAGAAAVAGALGLLALLAARLAGPVPLAAMLPVIGVAVAGGAVLSRSAPRAGSPGAVDNATGVVAVLIAAARLTGRRDVGVLITDAEEFGMEGARAWTRGRGQGRAAAFVNVDGVDARGAYRVMRHHRRGGGTAHGAAHLAHALADALRTSGAPVRVGALPPGVLVDGAVLAAAGMAGVTLSRGDWRTLRVVHTPRDAARRVDLAAAAVAGEAVAASLTRLLGPAPFG